MNREGFLKQRRSFWSFSFFQCLSTKHAWWSEGSSFRDLFLQGEFRWDQGYLVWVLKPLTVCSHFILACITSLFQQDFGLTKWLFPFQYLQNLGFEGAEGKLGCTISICLVGETFSLYHPRSRPQYSNVPGPVDSSILQRWNMMWHLVTSDARDLKRTPVLQEGVFCKYSLQVGARMDKSHPTISCRYIARFAALEMIAASHYTAMAQL